MNLPGSKVDSSARWADLTRRVASAIVMLALGVLLLWSQGWLLRGLVSLLVGAMFWELARITCGQHPQMQPPRSDPVRPLGLALLAGFGLFAAMVVAPAWTMWLALALPIALGAALVREGDRLVFAIFALAILLVGWQLVVMRESFGILFLVWLIGIVILSDTLGYFIGRIMGGPKFWPRISPKKTWSGTAAGWVGAIIWGLVFGAFTGKPGLVLAVVGVPICLAGQMGDIAESWFKRRAGVKDASDMIPGHGGLMDRFDALSGAILLAGLLASFGWLDAGGW